MGTLSRLAAAGDCQQVRVRYQVARTRPRETRYNDMAHLWT
jgi:hypothetical protein